MLDVLAGLRHNLKVMGCARELAKLADDLLRDYPEPLTLARRQARTILQRHTGKQWDPDHVWWHQFNTAVSSPRSFTGFVHYQRPIKSLRFTELMIERFSPGFQEASDELELYGGFYRQGPDATAFDEHNEVPLLGRDVQHDFWALDFGQQVREQVDAFWVAHGQGFQLLAKVSWLAQCKAAQRDGLIGSEDADALRAEVAQAFTDASLVPTMALLRSGASAGLWSVNAYPGTALGTAGFYLLHGAEGRVVWYMPYDRQPLRAFASGNDLAHWLRLRLQTPAGFDQVLQQVAPDPSLDVDTDVARTALRQLADSADDVSAWALIQARCRPVSGGLFAKLAADAAQNMRRTAEMITDNHRLREAMFSGYLAVGIRFACYFAPLLGGLGLAGAALGTLKLAVDLDLVTQARTLRERNASLRAAIMDAIFVTLSMVEMNAATLASHASVAYMSPFHEAEVSLAEWSEAASPQEALRGQEGNEVLDDKWVGSDELRGIRVGDNGACWIELDGLPYRVRYSNELKHWLIVDPDNPFAFGPLRPVRLDAQGRWRLLEPPRLIGGSPPVVSSAEPSAFWDEYMRLDEARSVAMSDAALARHEALLEGQQIAQVEHETDLHVDGEGFSYADDEGVPEYTYKLDGQYRNGLIEIYTADDSINDYLRHGTRDFTAADEVSFLNKLADSMELLPTSPQVPLFRGGHGVRGTSGQALRGGPLQVGDTLVNTDLMSFTENPYEVRQFASDPEQQASSGQAGLFDDTSVVFELPAGAYSKGVPITAFSANRLESETLFLPGSYFRIEALTEIAGVDYRFLKVKLRQVAKPQDAVVYELRTGQAFDKAAYTQRLGDAELVERFFGA